MDTILAAWPLFCPIRIEKSGFFVIFCLFRPLLARFWGLWAYLRLKMPVFWGQSAYFVSKTGLFSYFLPIGSFFSLFCLLFACFGVGSRPYFSWRDLKLPILPYCARFLDS